MKEYLIQYNELSECNEILNAKEPNFIVIFIYLVLIIIIGLFLWIWLGEIEDVIIAQGYVLPNQDVSIIRNSVEGYVKENNCINGQNVKKGDLLYTIDCQSIITEKDNLQIQIEQTSHDIDMLARLERSVTENKNYINKRESAFYFRYLSYKTNYDRLYSKFIEAQNNYFRIKNLVPEIVTKENAENLENSYMLSQLDLDNLKSNTLLQIKNDVRNKQDELLKYQNQWSDDDQKIKLAKILAPIDGIVQVEQIINQGEFIPSGMEILKIVPAHNLNYRMDISVNNQNAGLVKVGQEVKYNLLALPYQDFGFATGKIIYKSKDVASSDTMNYHIIGTIAETKLINKIGIEGKIQPGLQCEARIIVKKEKIILFLIEKLRLYLKL
jgi:multidrug resistance efflux pump